MQLFAKFEKTLYMGFRATLIAQTNNVKMCNTSKLLPELRFQFSKSYVLGTKIKQSHFSTKPFSVKVSKFPDAVF